MNSAAGNRPPPTWSPVRSTSQRGPAVCAAPAGWCIRRLRIRSPKSGISGRDRGSGGEDDVTVGGGGRAVVDGGAHQAVGETAAAGGARSEEHTSELQSLMRISYAVFCLKKKTET